VRDWLLRSRDNRTDERFMFTLATMALSEGCSTRTVLCSQLCRLADAHGWQGQAN